MISNHDNAHAGPMILKLEPPNNAANNHARIAAMSPCMGSAQLATARGIERQIETILTETQDLKFACNPG